MAPNAKEPQGESKKERSRPAGWKVPVGASRPADKLNMPLELIVRRSSRRL